LTVVKGKGLSDKLVPPVRVEEIIDGEVDLSWLFGLRDVNLRALRELSAVEVTARGNKVVLDGPPAEVERVRHFLQQLLAMRRKGFLVQEEDVPYAARAFFQRGQDLDKVFEEVIFVAPNKKNITPKNLSQKRYLHAIGKRDLVLGIGPAGTGKTFLAMAMAVSYLVRKKVSRIILTRPAVEAGERLGFLPGDLSEKIDPYLRPLYDALYQMMDTEKVRLLMERGTIEVAPLAFMRGRTIDDSFIVLDEAQNTTSEQMKMFLTRMGFNSKAVVTGDITQIDLPSKQSSGLIEARGVLEEVKGVETVFFTEKDVVRHELVQRIIRAYSHWEERGGAEAALPEGESAAGKVNDGD
jgi:phosphate starvation-inducible PhoH-like protein